MPLASFPLSLRNVADLLHRRGVDLSHETVRFGWLRLGPMFPAEIRLKRVDRIRACSPWRRRLDVVFVKINDVRHHLRRAVDHEGEFREAVVTKRRDKRASLRRLGKPMQRHGPPRAIMTDRLASCGAAPKALGAQHPKTTGRWLNNRAENPHLPRRRRQRATRRPQEGSRWGTYQIHRSPSA